jgi:4-hydroxy-3-polyprenylbenzoate decarboxylase
MPGVLAVQGPKWESTHDGERFCERVSGLDGVALVLLVDDSDFAVRHLNNWVWMAFTRSNPASDLSGVGASITHKHWGCTGPAVIDARTKPHHAPPLVEDPAVSSRIDELAARGGPLAGLW